MELKKKSFILHVDSLDVLYDLSDEQAGKLFKAMLAFHKGEEIELDPLTKMAFSFFKNQFIRDNEKYIKTCEARAQAGSKGGKQKQQNLANASKCKQKAAKVADSDKENDSDSDSDSDSKSVSKNKNAVSQKLDYSSWPSIPSEEVLKEWIQHRSRQKAKVTQLVINRLANELRAASERGYSVDDCLSECVVRGWRGFEAEWLKGKPIESRPITQQKNHDHEAARLREIEEIREQFR